MLISDEGENDVFFDSMDSLLVNEELELESGKLEYEVWMNEPQSVDERRRRFLHGMDLVEFSKDLERITDCSGAVPSSFNDGEGSMRVTLAAFLDRDINSEANLLVGESEQEVQNVGLESEDKILCPNQASLDECENDKVNRKLFKKWWKHLLRSRKAGGERRDESKGSTNVHKTDRMMVQPRKKGYMELTALCMGQEIQAHKGFIWTMKFSPDGQYLASGGEDGIVRIWRITSIDAYSKPFIADQDSLGRKIDRKSSFGRKKSIHSSIVNPEKIFHIEESPVQEFHGHAGDVLDLAWSNSNLLVSSSMDKTVRLWQVGCDECLNVFHHNNYVTCIQFNPIDENYFISGSIDGKVRIWGVSEKRVVHWVDVRDIITAICYRPDGKEFVVGSITGTCHFYAASGNDDVNLEAEIHIHGRRKTTGNKITSIQFSLDEPHKVMISSEDSKLRIFDGVDIVGKLKGLPKSGSQMSASFTSTGRHIISVGEDCHIYVWNYDDMSVRTSKHAKSVRSCEHFFCEDVSVAVPWSVRGADHHMHSADDNNVCRDRSSRECQIEDASFIRDSQRFSLANWFSIESPYKGSATWPEEKLPAVWDAAVAEEEDECYTCEHGRHLCRGSADYQTQLPETWGLVIVTGGWNGTIRTFHNYGLPVGI